MSSSTITSDWLLKKINAELGVKMIAFGSFKILGPQIDKFTFCISPKCDDN